MWQHDIYHHGVADSSVITETVGNGLVMLVPLSHWFFLSNIDLTLRFMKNGIETHKNLNSLDLIVSFYIIFCP